MKMSMKELQVGQQLITRIDHQKHAETFGNPNAKPKYYNLIDIDWHGFIPEGVVMEVVEKNNKQVKLKLLSDCTLVNRSLESLNMVAKKDTVFETYPSTLKSGTVEYGDILAHPDIFQYRVFMDGKMFKAKYYDDMGKIKAALLVMFDYHKDKWDLIQKYRDRNPELDDSYIPDYIEYGGSSEFRLTEDDTKDVEIMMYTNKKNPTVVDFNVHDYYKEVQLLSTVTYQFGSATRELFKNIYKEKEFKYILVYVPDEYRNKNKNHYFDYASLKESQRIKDVLKEVGVKDIKKTTKHGKTAIAFKNFDSMGLVISKLQKGEYYILDCEGDELIEQNERFIKLKQLGF